MMAQGVSDIAYERADAANGVVEDLKRNGLPEETAHDLLIGYTQAIEGFYKEEWGARKVMIQAGALPGSLNRYGDAKKREILKKVNGGKKSAPGHCEQGE
jgi:hypothetical protein